MKICTMYFSPAGTTEKILKSIAYSIKNEFKNYDVINIDFTNINNRQAEQSFSRDDLVIFGVPVIPVETKYFDDESYLKHRHELEIEFYTRRELKIYLKMSVSRNWWTMPYICRGGRKEVYLPAAENKK